MTILEENRLKAQSFLDSMKSIIDNFNNGSSVPSLPSLNKNGKKIKIGKDGKVLGYWENSSKFVYTNGDDIKLSEYHKKVKDLGFTWVGGEYKALTPDEYAKVKQKMLDTANVWNEPTDTKKYKITKDYDARHIFTDNLIQSTVVRPPKIFYKGDIVDAKIYQGKIVSGNYDITEVAELYDDKNVELQSEKEKSKLFTTNNILIGLAVIAVIGIGYYIINK